MYQKLISVTLILLFLTSCAPSLHSHLSKDDKGNNYYQGSYKIGSTYERKGVQYSPQHVKDYNKVGHASWYGSKFHNKKTANGDKYNKAMLTAAHPTLPMPSMVKVTNLKNQKSLIVMVNDRGPFTKKRIIDVSERTAEILGFKNHGIATVKIEYLADETQNLLKKLTLIPKHGSKTKQKVTEPACSVNCYIKLVNMKYKYHKF